MTNRVTVTLEELCRLFERLEDGVFFWGRDLKLLARNELACRLYGLDPADVQPGLDIIEFASVFPPVTWTRNVPPLDNHGGNDAEARERILRSFVDGMSFELRFDSDRVVVGNRTTFREGVLITVVTDVTERERAARELERQKTYLQTIIENLDEGVGLIEEGRCIAYNHRVLELYDIDPETVRPGMTAEAIVGANRDLALLPEHRRQEELADRVRRAKTQQQGTVRFTRELADGRSLDVSRTGLADGRAVMVVRDATERVRIARQRAYLNAIVDNIAEGVTLLDAEGRVIAFNRRALAHYGMGPEALQPGDHISEFVRRQRDLDALPAEEQVARRAERLALALRTDRGRVEQRRELGDGRILAVTRTPVDGGALFTYRDVTAEEERKRLLERAREEAERASRLKTEFLARVSHELRTPMQGVLGMTALLQRTALDAHQRQCLDVVEASGRHMLHLIEDLLTSSILEANALKLQPEPVDLAGLVNAAVEMVRPQAESRGLSLALEVEGEDAPVAADATRITQILVNLLTNAIRNTRSGDIRVRLATAPAGDGLAVDLAVSDTGSGIPGDKLEVIFERFSQLEAPPGEINEGVGLGLAVARSLARLMGGDIEVRSEVGQGSTFALRLDLPLAEAA